MNEKVIVTNLGALKAKYGTAGVKKINTAVKALIAADKARGLRARVIALDSAAAMKAVKGRKVKDAGNPRQNKEAVDAIYRKLVPDYLVLLGAVDVVPHQDLRNPVFDGDNDRDEFAFGDLPYACEAPYSQEPKDFVGPTRVIGRIPDLVGASEPGYLLGLLKTAAEWRARSAEDYADYFAVSAKVWKKSTLLSVQKLFGLSSDLHLSPKEGPSWGTRLLARRVHFINCHGGSNDPQFYGQIGKDDDAKYPVSHLASYLAGRISEGTVAATECCYGAELYDPVLATGQAGICSTYLAGKAYGYFGSSTIAYGPEEGNSAADLICQYFLRRVKAGASLGRATLEARLEFAGGAAELDPVDIKTLAQFNLLGDPSITPVATSKPHTAVAIPKGFAALARGGLKQVASGAVARRERRRQLFLRGERIGATQPVAARIAQPKLAGQLLGDLRKIAAEFRLKSPNFLSYRIEAPVAARKLIGLAAKAGPRTQLAPASAFHVVMGGRPTADAPVIQIVALVAKESAGKIVSYREMRSR
jgi:hypothetical protein